MPVTARLIKDVAQLLVGGAGNPGSREVLSPTNLVLELPARLAPQTLNVALLHIVSVSSSFSCCDCHFWKVTTDTCLLALLRLTARAASRRADQLLGRHDLTHTSGSQSVNTWNLDTKTLAGQLALRGVALRLVCVRIWIFNWAFAIVLWSVTMFVSASTDRLLSVLSP